MWMPNTTHSILTIALQLGDKGGEGKAYGNIGLAHENLGNYQEALIYHQKHLTLASWCCPFIPF